MVLIFSGFFCRFGLASLVCWLLVDRLRRGIIGFVNLIWQVWFVLVNRVSAVWFDRFCLVGSFRGFSICNLLFFATPLIFGNESRFAGITLLCPWIVRTKSVRPLQHTYSEPIFTLEIFGYEAFYEKITFSSFSLSVRKKFSSGSYSPNFDATNQGWTGKLLFSRGSW